jgi:hypothetical protein
LIREEDLDEQGATGLTGESGPADGWAELLGDRTILFLPVCVFAFHLANAPILPAVALYVKKLEGVALAAGRLCDSWGRKPVMTITFSALPVRILSYSLVRWRPTCPAARAASVP